mgnify:CR=1 FL=1
MKLQTKIGLDFEKRAHADGFRIVAGIDEVGRGCLAGPVVAGAVILKTAEPLPEGINDSKKLSKKKRNTIAREVRARAIAWSVGEVQAEEIDRINILEATKRAMSIAIGNLSTAPEYLLIDALELESVSLPQKAIIKGDAVSASIAAASIVAKVYRDNLMQEYDERYPEYGFASHVGYGTKAHFEAIRSNGPTPIHRKSFKGVL